LNTAGNGNDESRAYAGCAVISRDAFRYDHRDHLDDAAADVDPALDDPALDDPAPGVGTLLSSTYTTGNCPDFWPSIRTTPLLGPRGSLLPRTL